MEKQTILLTIDKEAKAEAMFMAKSFVNRAQKARVYVNTLGAECVIKYLMDNGVRVQDLHNMHSMKHVIERFDLSDIILSNVHLDVRVVFDEERIFVPKSHFKYGITPDLYVVVKTDKTLSKMELIGYFNPEIINEKQANDEYYFVSNNKLSDAKYLCSEILSVQGKKDESLSDSEMLRGRELSILMADHDISDTETSEFLQLLRKSSALRDSILEYDNFETLSYDVVHVLVNGEDLSLIEEYDEDEALYDEVEESDVINEDSNAEEDEKDIKLDDVSDTELVSDKNIVSEQDDENMLANDIEITNPDDLEDLSVNVDLPIEDVVTNAVESAENTVDAGAVGAAMSGAGTIGATAAAAAGMFAAGTASDEALELISNSGEDGIELDDASLSNEPVPEISTEEIPLDDAFNIENFNLEDVTETISLEPTGEISVSDVASEEISEPDVASEEISEPPTEAEFNTISDLSEFEDFSIDEGVHEDSEIFEIDAANSESIELKSESNNNESSGDISASEVMDGDDDLNLIDFDSLVVDGPQEYQATDAITEGEKTLASLSGNMAIENSKVITEKDMQPGEIPIDINMMEQDVPMPSESLENIYNDSPNMATEVPFNNSVRIGSASKSADSSKSKLLLGLLAVALLAGLSFAGYKYFKSGTQVVNNPLTPNPEPIQSDEDGVSEDLNTLNLDKNNVANIDGSGVKVEDKAPVATQPVKKLPATTFLSLKKLSWEVPDYISYNAAFKQYFQSAGKSIRASLSSDLLLADEYAYSNLIKVSVLYDKSGGFKEAKILQSSGSAQIDKIVLQSLNQTLKVLKAPSSVGNDESTTVILKIYL